MKGFIGCILVSIAFVLLRFFFTCPKSLWHRLSLILQNLFFSFQQILYWGSLIAGLALCFISNINLGFLALGCFLCFHTMSLAVLSLKRIPILDNEPATIIGVISLILGLTLFFITSAKHGFIALGSVLSTFLIVRFLMRIEIVFTKKKILQSDKTGHNQVIRTGD